MAQLRLAVAMRGGVSLAVWIGGALAEIDVMRRALADGKPTVAWSDPNEEVYSLLLRLAGYSSVQVDVLSGASAGGLNGAIYAASLMYGFDFRHMLPIWVRLADLESMTRVSSKQAGRPGRNRRASRGRASTEVNRRSAPPVWRPADSLLEGDEYFLRQLREELTTLVQSAGLPRGTEPGFLDLVLTGTLVHPAQEQIQGSRAESFDATRSAAFFQFHHEGSLAEPGDRTPQSHFSTDRAATVARLALAGRASASFPFAFEPATVSTDSAPSWGFDQPSDDLTTVFSERGAPGGQGRGQPASYRVMDGGVLDNIPIARAIEAVAASPAAEPTDRWLVYLFPSPSDAPAPVLVPASTPVRAIATVRRTVSALLGQESLLDDIAVLSRHNNETLAQTIRWRGLWQSAGPDPHQWITWLRSTAITGVDAMLANRADLDSVRLLDALDAPRRRYAGRPEVMVDPGDPFAALRSQGQSGIVDVVRSGLRDALHATYAADQSGFGADAIVARSAIDLLIGACRAVERAGSDMDLRVVGPVKHTLYGLRTLTARAVLAAEIDLVEALNVDPPTTPDAVGRWLSLHLSIVTVPPKVIDGLAAALNALREPVCSLMSEDVLLRPYRMLGAPLLTLADLLTMARLTTPMLATTVQNPSPLTFKVISGAAPTPLAREFQQYRRPPSPSGNHAPTTDSLYVNDKLAGNALANFSAFLKASWRVNDWTWGRCDSASRLAESLVDRFHADRPATVDLLTELVAIVIPDCPPEFMSALMVELGQDELAMATPLRDKLRNSVITHLQLTLWRHHLPLVEQAQMRAEPTWSPKSPVLPPPPKTAKLDDALQTVQALSFGDTRDALHTYGVGREGLSSITAGDRRRIAMRLAKICFAAIQPADPQTSLQVTAGEMARGGRRARVGRVALSPVRPVVFSAIYAVAAPMGALIIMAAMAVALLVSWWARDLAGWGWQKFLVPGIPALLLITAAVLVVMVARSPRRLASVLVVSSLGIMGLAVAVDQLNQHTSRFRSVWTWAGWIAVCGVGIALFSTTWMRPVHRAVATLTTGGIYLVTAACLWRLSGAHGSLWRLEHTFPAGWWAVLSIVGSAVGLAVHVSVADVFVGRPGRDRRES